MSSDDGMTRDRVGFRLRGLEMTRIEVFTDAAFAFAVTMLVISVDSIPSSMAELWTAMLGVPAFAASFAQVMVFWYAHHIWSRRYGQDDMRTILLSALLVFLVLVFIYPLKTMYSSALHWFTDGYLPSVITFGTWQDLRTLFTVFGLSFIAMSGAIVLLYLHSWSQQGALELDARERVVTRYEVWFWLLMMLPAVVSIVLSYTLPPQLLFIAGMAYSLLGVVMPIWGSRFGKALEAA